MFRGTLVIILVGMLLATIGLQPVSALMKQEADSVEKIRADIAKIGIGKQAKVKVKLRDNTRLQGYILETAQDSFTIVESETANSRVVAYSDVAQVSKQGFVWVFNRATGEPLWPIDERKVPRSDMPGEETWTTHTPITELR